MIIRKLWALCALSFLLDSSGIVKAGTLTTTTDTVAADLANALTTGGAGGITITSESLSDNHFESIHNNKVEDIDSSGVFSTVGTNNFGLSGSGIVISTGNAAQDGTTGPGIYEVTTDFGASATRTKPPYSIRSRRRHPAGTTPRNSTSPLRPGRTPTMS